MAYVAGIDVGGTNTDAVALRDGEIVATAKLPTTADVQTGVFGALAAIRGQLPFDRVHIGTTALTNALVERRGLAPAAAIRIGAPVSAALPPMIDWPEDLRAAVNNLSFFIRGGREYDGRPIAPLDRAEVERAATSINRAGIRQVAITAVFGTSYPADEVQVAQWLKAAAPEIGVTLSHRIGRFGILERESAALINAMLRPLADRTLAAYAAAVSGALFISQNDGTVMNSAQAAELPVFTLASGPTNSLRGAAMLTGLSDAVVLDVGGTTTDAGLLHEGYPQLARLDLEVAGVRTNFRMPDLVSVGLGGGSLVEETTGTVGPRSVGFRLTEEALVFGGNTLTLTDVAVAAGRAEIGEAARVSDLPASLISRVDNHLRERLVRLIENFERSGRRLPVVLVGGGAGLVEEILRGTEREIIRPQRANVANAYGAALAQVAGEADMTFAQSAIGRAQALAQAEREAHARAARAGARPETIKTVELEDAALSYLASSALRVRAKAVGDL